MGDLKRLILRIIFILCVLGGGLAFAINIFKYFIDALKWIVFIDNAETGLPWQWEIVIKGIVEAIVVGIATCFGISKNNPFISLFIIILGFVCCIFFYYIAKYILWILAALAIILATTITYTIIQKRKEV